MNDGSRMEGIRLQVVNGRLKMGAWSADGSASAGPSADCGSMYSICHVAGHDGDAVRLCDRVEGIAQETYRRSPGGVTNGLRQALRNANRYLYLRNRARGDRPMIVAAMSCVAVRGSEAYACGVGPQCAFIVSGSRVRAFANPVEGSGIDTEEGADRRRDVDMLGLSGLVSDPRFSYRQVLPGDLVMMIAADESQVFQDLEAALAPIAFEKDFKVAAQHIARLGGKSSNLSAVLVRVRPDNGELRESAEMGRTGAARKSVSRERLSPPVHRAEKGGEVREPLALRWRRSSAFSRVVQASRDETPADRGSGPELATDLRGKPSAAVALQETQRQRFLQRSVEMCRLAGVVLFSLVYKLWTGGSHLLRSARQLVGRGWSWMTRHHVLERLLRGCELTLLACWAGLKGLIMGVLPERQGSATTYGASAHPMARARVVGFHPSPRSRLVIGALVMLGVLLVVAASAVRVRSRLEQAELEPLMTQVEGMMQLAEGESDKEGRIAVLSQAWEVIDQAAAIQVGDDVELGELHTRLQREWDAATGVVRIPLEMDQMPTMSEGAPGRVLAYDDQLYVLDTNGQRLHGYALDQEGKPVLDQDPWIWEVHAQGDTASSARIVDMTWVEAADGRQAPGLLLLTTAGTLLELNSEGLAHEVSISDVLSLENAHAIGTYHGSLYVLDLGRENIIKYIPTEDNYDYPPVHYFQDPGEIEWAGVIDMAIGDSVYLLLSNGPILRYAAGEPQTFTQEGLYPPLKHPEGIFASPDSASVFVAEPVERRIVEFTTSGQFVRQFRAARGGESVFEALSNFEVNLRHDRMFISTASGLYEASLPSLQ